MFGLLIIIAAFMSFLSIIFIMQGDNKKVYSTKKIEFSGQYQTKEEDPQPLNSHNVVLPSSFDEVTFIGHFDQEILENEIMSLRTNNLYIKMYVNNTLIFEDGKPYQTMSNVRSSGNGWFYFGTPKITPNDEVKIVIKNLYKNYRQTHLQDFLTQIYIGNPLGMASNHIQQAIIPGLISISIIFIGIFQLGLALVRLIKKSPSLENIVLGILAILVGTYFLFNFKVVEIFSPYPILNNSIQSLSLYLAFCIMLTYISMYLSGKSKVFMRYNAFLAGIIVMISIICQHSGYIDYFNFRQFLYAYMGLTCFHILICEVIEYRKNNQYKKHSLMVMFLPIAVIIDVILNYQGYPYYFIFQVSFFIFLCWQIYEIWSVINKISLDVEKLKLLQEDKERQEHLLEYQHLISQSTQGLYDIICELDITHNCVVGDTTKEYYDKLGIDEHETYDRALKNTIINQVKEEYQQGYLDMFSRESVIQHFKSGKDTLQYDYLFSETNEDYYWVRTNARVFFWPADQSIRMITYQQNVDREKRREISLLSRAKRDPLTGLLNRESLKKEVGRLIRRSSGTKQIGCLMLDLDNFKKINDQNGHMVGDQALIEFSKLLKLFFRENDLICRLGGDEFTVFLEIDSLDMLKERVKKLLISLHDANYEFDDKKFNISVSIGITLLEKEDATYEDLYKQADRALYHSKKMGKNRYTVYG